MTILRHRNTYINTNNINYMKQYDENAKFYLDICMFSCLGLQLEFYSDDERKDFISSIELRRHNK